MGVLEHFAVICKECGGRRVSIGIGTEFFRFMCPECQTQETHAYAQSVGTQGTQEDPLVPVREMWRRMQEEGYGDRKVVPYDTEKVEEKLKEAVEPPPPPPPSKTTMLMKELIEEHDLDRLEQQKQHLSSWEYQYVKEQITKIQQSLQKQAAHE